MSWKRLMNTRVMPSYYFPPFFDMHKDCLSVFFFFFLLPFLWPAQRLGHIKKIIQNQLATDIIHSTFPISSYVAGLTFPLIEPTSICRQWKFCVIFTQHKIPFFVYWKEQASCTLKQQLWTKIALYDEPKGSVLYLWRLNLNLLYNVQVQESTRKPRLWVKKKEPSCLKD